MRIRWLQALARRVFGASVAEPVRTAPGAAPSASEPAHLPNPGQLLVAEARAKYNAGQGVEGLNLTRAASAVDPDAAELHYVQGLCLAALGRHDEALDAFRRELANNPQHAEARNQCDALAKALAPPVLQCIPTHQRDWHSSIPRETLLRVQQALHNYHYRGVPLLKDPFDLALYPLLLWQLKPRTIIEIGSKSGGSALWFADQLNNLQIDGHVYSVDIVRVTDVKHPRVTFLEGSGRNLATCLAAESLRGLRRPWLVIEDADHTYETSIATLNFFHPLLQADEYIVIEDGIISDLSQVPDCNSGPHVALKEFLREHPEQYEIDGNYCDFFGYNATWCTNGFLRKFHPGVVLRQRQREIEKARELIDRSQSDAAFAILNALKAQRVRVRDTDYLRALCFVARKETLAAIEALKEELRYFPENHEAGKMLADLLTQNSAESQIEDTEFLQILEVIRPYTMVGEGRLHSLFRLAKRVCEEDLPGNFVECGVGAGGSSALLATVIARHSKRPRKLFAFDTFEGMPEASALDLHAGKAAEETGWGAGTCSAPQVSVRDVSLKLGVEDLVEPIKGLFADTLPAHRARIGQIAFLHLDGDWYHSTREILDDLFDAVSAGAPLQVDDYGYWDGCKRAVGEFQHERGLNFKLNEIDGIGVWFLKENIGVGGGALGKTLLNVGCGRRVHDDWVNLDLVAHLPGVIPHDIRRGLPFRDNSFSAVYHSHVLEHLRRSSAHAFLRECYRVLAQGGILRVAVP